MKLFYKLSDSFLLTDVEDGIILMPVSPEKIKEERFFSTDGIGAMILNMIKENKSVDEILNKVVSEYDVDIETARNDICEFLTGLEKEGIVEVNA